MNSPVDASIIDDTAAQVSYFPAGAWRTNKREAHYNRTYHYTDVTGAYLTFRFNGSFAAYCSNMAAGHGDFFVSVDGRPFGTGSGYAEAELPAQALFTVSVEPGAHVLNISNAAAPAVLTVDYFITAAIPPLKSSAPGQSPTHDGPPGSSEPSTRHAISASPVSKSAFYAVLGLLCGLAAVSATLATLLFVARRRARRAQQAEQPPLHFGRPDPPAYSIAALTEQDSEAALHRAQRPEESRKFHALKNPQCNSGH